MTHVVLPPGGLLVSVLGSPLGGGATKIFLLPGKSDKSKLLVTLMKKLLKMLVILMKKLLKILVTLMKKESMFLDCILKWLDTEIFEATTSITQKVDIQP